MLMINVDNVINRLNALGFVTNNGDKYSIEYCISDTEEFICNFCNIDEIPEALKNTAIKYATGLFLKNKLSSGKGFDGFDVRTDGVSSISEGDTSISYDTSKTSYTENLINNMLDIKVKLIPFRKLRW